MRAATVGLVGCGRWGRHILRDLVSLGCRVVVADPAESTRRHAAAAGAAAVVASPDGLPDVDGIVVATPTTTHAAVIDALLDRRVPIFCEKPLTADPAEALRLADLAPRHLFVMDKWRYHPGILLLAEIARSGDLGPVAGLRTTRVQWGNVHRDVDGLWILAPHELSIALEVLGRIPAPRAAVGERDGRMATGLVGILGTEPWHVLEVSTRSHEKRREVRLQCDGGVAILEDGYSNAVRVVRATDGGSVADAAATEWRPISTELPLLRELRAFVDHLRGGPPPRSSAAEGAQVVATLAALRDLAGLTSRTSDDRRRKALVYRPSSQVSR